MSIYTLATEAPIQAGFEDAETDTVVVEEQVISEAEIFITQDSYTEVKAGLFFGERRVFPSPPGKPIQKPGTTGPAPVNFKIPGVPNTLTLRAWAPNADFRHRVVCNVVVVPAEDANPLQRLVDTFRGRGTVRDASQQLAEQ